MSDNAEQRTAIVTGGLTGIGLAIAANLCAQGIRVAVGSRSAADNKTSANARAAVGQHGLVLALDVRSIESINTFMNTVHETLGVPDILINAAGVSVHQIVEGHSDEDWNAVIDVNLSGAFRMVRACLTDMKARKWGRIVNIASTAARVAVPTHAAYCASKAGLVAFSKAVAIEGAPFGVNCVSISPGWVETDMLHTSANILAQQSGRTKAEEIAAMAASNPQNRLIQPQEVAAITTFCCSDAAIGLTMEDIQINAGALW